jgi:purine-binding chemotaxis protein CheW
MTEVAAPPQEPVAEEIAEAPKRRLLVFQVGDSAFAAAMNTVRELVPAQTVTRLPGAPATVSGLINLRGTIVTVLDAGICLGESPWRKKSGLVLLAGYGDKVIGIGIDDVRDIHDAAEEQFSDAPASARTNVAICGVVEIEDERVPLLDVQTMVREVLGQEEAG